MAGTDDDPLRIVLPILVALLLIPLILMVVMMPFGMMGGGQMWAHGGQGTIWMWMLWIVLLGILLALTYLLYRVLTRSMGGEAGVPPGSR